MRSPSLSATPPRPPGPPSAETLSLPGSNRSLLTRALGKERPSGSPPPHKSHLRPKVLGNKTRRPHQSAKEVVRPCLRSPRPSARGRSGLRRLEIDEGPEWGWRWNALGVQDSGLIGRARGLARGLAAHGISSAAALGGEHEVCASGLCEVGVGRGLDRKGDCGRSLAEVLARDGGYDPDPEQVILLVGGSGSLAPSRAPLRPGSQGAFEERWACRGRLGVRRNFLEASD